ncbi:hypothetical protein [Cohnella abietis]|uniref:Uncharacterized protein n=1 Tax=Cohnella abietis TaxID=2507935 RepID=A0A3T1D725_9BACL|nr:hypothetical protein [Cohnella abietis]BBI33886.1 hypothetical protein KCTCHS21_32850 [Cohnella abietis]
MKSGEVLVTPRSAETVENLGAPSCYGTAEDYSIKADYDVFFKSSDGKKRLIKLPEINTFIVPENKQIELPVLNFDAFQVVIIAPQYTDCHGVSFYMIGIKDKVAIPFKFKTGDGTSESFSYAPNSELIIINNQLEVVQGLAAGNDEQKKLVFKPDFKNGTMQLVKSTTIRD